MKKCLIINFIVIFILFILSETCFFIELYKQGNFNSFFFPYCCKAKNLVSANFGYYPPSIFENTVSKKRPILLLGCSYVLGHCINKNLSYYLYQLTGRTAYNWGEVGQNIICSYFQLEAEEEKSILPQKPEYIIYVYMFDHLAPYRFLNPVYYSTYRKNNYIPFQKYNIFDNLYTVTHFKNVTLGKYLNDDPDYKKRLNLFYNILKDVKLKTDKLFPNSKFIFLIYSDINKDINPETVSCNIFPIDIPFNIMNSNEFKSNIEKMGIEVLTTEELIGRKMDRPSDRVDYSIDIDYPHPSEKAWEEIVPALVKRLNL